MQCDRVGRESWQPRASEHEREGNGVETLADLPG